MMETELAEAPTTATTRSGGAVRSGGTPPGQRTAASSPSRPRISTEIQLLTVNVWTNSREAVHNENTKVNFFFKYLALLSAPMGNGTPLQYSCLENPMDGGTWKAAVHGVAEAWTQLSDFTFTFNFHALEKEMATHFSVLAWRIPGTGECQF